MKQKNQPPDGFRQILEQIARRHDLRRVFEALIRLAACALAVQTREAEYLAEAKHWEKSELDLFGSALGALVSEMDARPFEDLLGGYYMECALSNKAQQWNGEFHTPKAVCDLMAQITFDMESLPAEGFITVCEPACGAGAMILSLGQLCPPAIRRRLRVTAIDISRTTCDMAFINTTLWGIPTRIIHGNTLSQEYWAAWSNIHYCPLWPATGQGQPPKPDEVERLKSIRSSP
jgi:type I restriction-modification system DNA methylase subunit